MADRGDTHYTVSNLNKWFLFSSVFMLIATVWMVIDDYEAPWKKSPAGVPSEIELERAETELAGETALALVADEDAAQVETSPGAPARAREDVREAELDDASRTT